MHSTLIPEPFTLNRETGAKGEGSKIEGTGYGVAEDVLLLTSALERCGVAGLEKVLE